MNWSVFSSPDDSTELAKLLDQFEAVRPSAGIERFCNAVIKVATEGIDTENIHIKSDMFERFALAKSLEKLLLIYEWQRANGQKGVDRHIQTVEAQLMPLYEMMVTATDLKIISLGDDNHSFTHENVNEIDALKKSANVDQLSDAQELFRKTKEAIAKIAGGKHRST